MSYDGLSHEQKIVFTEIRAKSDYFDQHLDGTFLTIRDIYTNLPNGPLSNMNTENINILADIILQAENESNSKDSELIENFFDVGRSVIEEYIDKCEGSALDLNTLPGYEQYKKLIDLVGTIDSRKTKS